ncbi:lipid droplet-associated protein [Amycolatopsis aidingensis]|uniref:lipid droplet-associated protein n=1 Tax=Amycolatopsis aidingensis TaxID=2842453 RepID=UPI001C0AB32D|nr:lipid droplet-associated protein [Amycolatopsis aidingensis]
MKPLPFPLRVAAGLAVTTAERVRELPKQVLGCPVTVASQVLQASMRVQQHITELAIKGDDALSALRPVEETPSWATFDEDITEAEEGTGPAVATADDAGTIEDLAPPEQPRHNGHRPDVPLGEGAPAAGEDPWADEERALAAEHADGEFDSAPRDTPAAPAGLADYDQLTLPQVRARLRQFSLDQLEELLAYERAHADRASFVGMLARRIGNVRREREAGEGDAPGDPTDR